MEAKVFTFKFSLSVQKKLLRLTFPALIADFDRDGLTEWIQQLTTLRDQMAPADRPERMQ